MTATQTPPAAAAARHGVPFLLRAADRPGLAEACRTLARLAADHPDVPLADLAADFASAVEPGGVRVGIVADSAADLGKKLARAADRIADPKCRQVRDAAGVYFFAEPLHPAGSVALLFPGEGAQYPGMLADLCGPFPEVEATFAWADEVAAAAGKPSLRRLVHPPDSYSAEEKVAAEAELRQLGPSIFGVLLADQALYRVVEHLQLPVAAAAGHSAGEIAALLAAGAAQAEEVLGPRLAEIMDLMQHQEAEAGGPEAALLAVAAGRDAVAEAAEAVAGGAVAVAMDNCPHQCVAVGPAHLVAAVELALAEKGVACERLPFRRPYHTPLFEPWMGPFRSLFAGVPFAAPRVPVYSCTTGEVFPDDPAAIRDLAVNNWCRPVAFTRLIERMHADGVRVFVEVGPRGNLSAFVEDTLRGRPAAAVPLNTARRSGPTQLSHAVAQLFAHGVPVNAGHLFAATSGEASGRRPPAGATQHHGSDTSHDGTGPHRPADAGRSPADVDGAMHGHLAVMEQFLDVQREVMEAYLAGGPACDGIQVLPPKPYALVGEVVRHVAGQEVVFRRLMDEAEHLYADHHTLGGRGVSRCDPGQNGLPVLPMTFSLEAMAEAASMLAPGKVVVAVRNVRLHRWLPFDPEPTTLEVRAVVAAIDDITGMVEVRADVRDLGNSFLKDGASKVASEAVVVLADRYPEPPPPRPFVLSNETGCRCSVADLHRNMFHGPLFRMIREMTRTGDEGIEGVLEVHPRDGWFRSDPDPHTVLDPVLTDATMHVLGAWHLEQPDWTGRILLPFEVAAVEYFGPPPAPGTVMLVRGYNEQSSARHYRHGVEAFGPDGRPWLRLTGAGYWRFYLPFGHVNFFGPKDEYYLSSDWPDAVPPGSVTRRCHYLEPPADLRQPVLRAAGARVTMTPRELAEFRAWAGPDGGLSDWFFGRLLAKDAARAAWAERSGRALFPADLETHPDDRGRYVVRFRGEPEGEPLPPVSVAVCNGKVAAFAAFARFVGLALEPAPKAGPDLDARKLAAVRAVADALAVDPAEVELLSAEVETGLVRGRLAPAAAARCPELAGRRLVVRTARRADVVAATTLCETDPA